MKKVMLLSAVFFVAGLLQAEDKVIKEDWDWATAMIQVAKKGKDNKEGVVLSLGDSITYANQSTRWAKSQAGATPEDKAVCEWSHANKKDDTDGWNLASVDMPGGRSETASSGIRVDEYLKGGQHGLPSLKAILEKYKPQVAFILLGANDASANRKPEDVAKDMGVFIDAVLANNTIPVLQTVAPRGNDKTNELTVKYNELYLTLAKEKKIPLIDLYGEFVTRAPNGAYKKQLLSGDGTHFSGERAGNEPTPDNLANCGYLLRCWLSVKKLEEIKKNVIDKAK